MWKLSSHVTHNVYTRDTLTIEDGHRKDKMLEQIGHQNQNSSVWQKELCWASWHKAANQLSKPTVVGSNQPQVSLASHTIIQNVSIWWQSSLHHGLVFCKSTFSIIKKYHQQLQWVYGCRRGSVVRMSVFDWQTFLHLRLIYGWHVTTSWVRCPLWVISLPSLWSR